MNSNKETKSEILEYKCKNVIHGNLKVLMNLAAESYFVHMETSFSLLLSAYGL